MQQILSIFLIGLICAGTLALVAFLSLIVPTIAAVLVWCIVQVLGGQAGFWSTWVITTCLYCLVNLVVKLLKK